MGPQCHDCHEDLRYCTCNLKDVDRFDTNIDVTIIQDKPIVPDWNKPVDKHKIKSNGGSTKYYDMPFNQWITTNDMMEYLAEHKWGKYGIHLKDIFKGLCRWGEKEGTDTIYDTRKIIYYGLRVLRMMIGIEKTREYLQDLLNDSQFGGK